MCKQYFEVFFGGGTHFIKNFFLQGKWLIYTKNLTTSCTKTTYSRSEILVLVFLMVKEGI